MSDKRIKVLLGFVALGCVLRFTGAISPMHELMHWALGTFGGDQVDRVTWARTYYSGQVSDLTIAGAYYLEVILLTLLAMKWRNWFTAFWFGSVHALIIWAPQSEDFARVPSAIGPFIFVWLIFIALGWWRVVHKLPSTAE